MKLRVLTKEYLSTVQDFWSQSSQLQGYTTINFRYGRFFIESVQYQENSIERHGLRPVLGRRYYTKGKNPEKKFPVNISMIKYELKKIGIELVTIGDSYKVVGSRYHEGISWSKSKITYFFLRRLF